MRIFIYTCLAVLTAALSGCIWGPGGGYRGDRNDGHRGNGVTQEHRSDGHVNDSQHSHDQGWQQH